MNFINPCDCVDPSRDLALIVGTLLTTIVIYLFAGLIKQFIRNI